MMGNMFLSFGSLFFSILLTIVYFIKSKQTNVNNKVFKLLLIILNFTVLSEIITILIIYYMPDKLFVGKVISRINMIFTISWIANICCYMLTIENTDKIVNYKQYVRNNKDIKILIIIYSFSIIISFFLEFNNFSNVQGAYISGTALYFMYVVGSIAVFTSIIRVLKINKELPRDKTISIVIGIVLSAIAMILQLIFPMNLVITCMFVLDTYIIYFTFENPDLYLIKELESAKKIAEDSNKAKTDFLSNMSHEIRTPMNAILGFSDGILTESKFDSRSVKKDIEYIYYAGNNLLEIINNILDISKIENGEEKLENKPYSIGNMVLELKSIIQSRIDRS